MLWFYLSIGSLITFSLYELISRHLSIQTKNPVIFAGIYNLAIVILSPLLLLIEPIPQIKLTPLILIYTLISFSIWAMFGKIEYLVHKNVEASTLSIIQKLAPALTAVLGIIFLGESVNLNKIVGICILIGINYWLLIATEGLKTTKGLKLALVLTLLLSFGWFFDKIVSPHFGIFAFTFLSFIGPVIASLLIPPKPVIAIKAEIANSSWKIFIPAFLNLAGYGMLIKALQLGEASRITPIATATTPFVVLLGALFLHERSHLKIKIIATIGVIIGIYLLK